MHTEANADSPTGVGEGEIAALRAEVAQYEEEFALLKNQEVSIRRLEEEVASLQDMREEAIAEATERRTTEILQEMHEKQLGAEKQIGGLLDALKAAQAESEKATQQVRAWNFGESSALGRPWGGRFCMLLER